MSSDLPTIHSMSELAALVKDRRDLFVRWSSGPDADLERDGSRDSLTGVRLPGLSASSLAVEPWWKGRSVEVWVARRLIDYEHLRRRRPATDRPWVLEGRECGRGPDNEPLVEDVRPVAWVGTEVIDEASAIIDRHGGEWGPLDREARSSPGGS